ncbi:MAG TPA: hypothetical protein VEQ65_02925, partial [Opitutus sp.]|nr:hypothetical protein [Opitutus sp.]
FFRRFGGSASHLAVATAALVEAGAPGLVERCVDEAAQQGFALGPFKLHMVQARLDARDWDGAARALAEAQRAGGAQTPTDEFVRHWLEELVGVVTGEAPGARLMELAERGPLPFRLHRQTCEALVRAGRYDAAESLLRIAERSFPTSRRWSELRAEMQRAAMPTRQTSSTVAPAEVSGTAFSAKIAEAP